MIYTMAVSDNALEILPTGSFEQQVYPEELHCTKHVSGEIWSQEVYLSFQEYSCPIPSEHLLIPPL